MPHATSRTSDVVLRTFTVVVLFLFAIPAAAADHFGRVTFGGLPVPGATVTSFAEPGGNSSAGATSNSATN